MSEELPKLVWGLLVCLPVFFLRKLDESVQMVIRRSNSDPSPNHIESEKTFEKTNQQETLSERSRISGFI